MDRVPFFTRYLGAKCVVNLQHKCTFSDSMSEMVYLIPRASQKAGFITNLAASPNRLARAARIFES